MKKLQKTLDFLRDKKSTLQNKLVSNSISEEAKLAVEETLKNLTAAEEAIAEALANAEAAEDDKTAELKARVDEVLNELESLRKKVDEAPVENSSKKAELIQNSVGYAWDFLQTVKNSASAAEFKVNYNALKSDYGISPDTAFLPGSMVKAITDGFSGKHRLLELVDWTGLPMFRALYETGNQIGYVHTKGTKKTEQALTFNPIDIRPDIIYKYLSVDKVMLKQCDTPEQANVLLQYITKELLDRVLCTVENGILTGTGPFVAPTAVDVTAAGDNLIQQIYSMLEKMDNYTNPVLICNKANYFKLKQSLAESALMTGVMPSDEQAASILGCREIITFNTVAGSGLWVMQPEDYKLVGDLRPDQYNSFNLEYNKEQYLTEIYIGGGSINPNNFVTGTKQS